MMEDITATQFAKIWKQFDLNDSGTIERKELDAFFYEYAKDMLKKEPTKQEHADIKERFMGAFVSGPKITMRELAEVLLPSDEGFILLFRMHVPLESSVSFMQIWRLYDENCNGYISRKELKKFILDVTQESGVNISKEQLNDYTKSIIKLFDTSGDGRLDLQDMARLLNISNNFLLQFKIQDGSMSARRDDFEKIFKRYDESNTGALDDEEVDGFVKDMAEAIQKNRITGPELDKFKKNMMLHADLNKDGKLQKAELAMALGVRLK